MTQKFIDLTLLILHALEKVLENGCQSAFAFEVGRTLVSLNFSVFVIRVRVIRALHLAR